MELDFFGISREIINTYALDLTNLVLIEKILDESEKNNFHGARIENNELGP
jgi:hypothetical protein